MRTGLVGNLHYSKQPFTVLEAAPVQLPRKDYDVVKRNLSGSSATFNGERKAAVVLQKSTSARSIHVRQAESALNGLLNLERQES